MSVFEMVLGIVIFSCLAGIANNYIKMKASSKESQVDDEAEARIQDLQERVQVLERVITDDRSDLKKQIDRLDDD